MNKLEKGITLITLVITIIIMLILAAIVLNLSLGDNGLLKKAKDITKKWSLIDKNEKEDLAKLGNAINNSMNKQGR